MPSEITLPACLTTFFRELFPTLKWERIHFYLGLPWPYSYGDQGAMTMPARNARIAIYIAPEKYMPCGSTGFVTTIAHELVHALQIQSSFPDGKGIGRFHVFTIKYMTCWSRHWQAKNDHNNDSNPYELEAYEYDDKLRRAITDAATGLPCVCAHFGPPERNPGFIGAAGLAHGELIKRKAKQIRPCRGQAGRIGALLIWDGTAGDPFMNILGWTLMGAIIGFFLGGPTGALAGFLGGMGLGAFDELTGIPSFTIAIAAALTGLMLDITVALATAVSELLGGPGNRPLKIRFSLDEGTTFGEASLLGMSSEPPAAVFDPDRLFIGWKSPENNMNVLVVPVTGVDEPTLTTFGNADGDSGPALAWGNGLLYLLWQREDNKLYVRTSTDGVNFNERVQFQGKVPDDATPGVAYGDGRAFAAWVRKRNNRVGMKASSNGGGSWGNETTFSFGSHDAGTAAVAYHSRVGTTGLLFVARATSDQRQVKVATLGITPSGDTWVAQDLDLGVSCCDDTGPAVAAGNGRVFVSWIGRAEQHPRVRVFIFNPGGALTQVSETVLSDERGKDNAGPALAYAENIGGTSVLALIWVRKND